VEWHVGVRRLHAERDWGLVGSVSVPFGSKHRAEPDIRAAQAELAAIEFEREGEHLALQATLAEAWSQLDLAVATAQRIDTSLLPVLQRAARAAEQSYRAGASSYLEWAQLQSDVTAAGRERLDASLAAHRALIELQRLTGETLQVAAGHNTDSTP
jgi:cobalt-zinc-cadmium efflux system outer membrane protein